MIDLSKLAKLMELSTSPVDNEALTSIRMANKILFENNISWSEFIGQKTIIIQEIQQITQKTKPDADIEKMLSECLINVRSPSGKTFIESLNKFYKQRGYLTPKQVEALRKWFDNL